MKLKTLISYRGGEFTSTDFSSYCLNHGIKRQLTTPYSPQHNMVVERKNKNVMSMVRAMLKEKNLPRELWGEAVSTIVYNQSFTHKEFGGSKSSREVDWDKIFH